jgi:eukaryotic-like serine/threonine-protein kinase
MSEEFGPYLIHEQLGVGPTATVHRAIRRDAEGLSRPVALRRLLPQVAADPRFVRAFEREARRSALLVHPNIAQVHEVGQVGESWYVATELVTGVDLDELLDQLAGTIGPMPVAHVLNLLSQICAGLDHAHNLHDSAGAPLGLVHRDLSPAHLVVAHDGTVKMIDFGISRPLAGVVKTRSSYQPPEVATGRFDAHGDLFAVGAIGHELLAARPLTDDTDVPPPSRFNVSVEPGVDELILTALARDPEARWRSAARMRHEIDRLIGRYGHHASNGEVHGWIDWAMHHRDGDPAVRGRDPSVTFPRARTPVPEAMASNVFAAYPSKSAPAPAAPPRRLPTVLILCAALLIVVLVVARLL